MPDERRGWTANDIVTIIGAVFSGLALLISTWNNAKIGDVTTRQVEQVQKAEVISQELVVAKRETEERLDRLAEKTADVGAKIQVLDSKLPGK